MKRSMMLALLMACVALPFTGCKQEGPAEEAGEAVDEAVENAGDAVEDATH